MYNYKNGDTNGEIICVCKCLKIVLISYVAGGSIN